MAKTTGSKSENSMKRSGEIREKQNIWKWIAIGSVAAVGIFCLAAGVFLRRADVAELTENTSDETQLVVETEAYRLEEKMAEDKPVRKFVDQGAPEAEEGDNRDVFRIIEVIPHEACSIFPYYVDWKTPEGYNANTPLGYDGLLVAAQLANTGESGDASAVNMFSKQEVAAKDSRPYTYIIEQQVKDYFENYADYTGFADAGANNRGARWFRKTKDQYALLESEYGYFEYVGENNGLFYINTSRVAGEVIDYGNWQQTIDSGIHFEIQAVPRDGAENPKGYIYVKDPAYYWSKDSAGISMPDYNSNQIKGLTKYNYDIEFQKSDVGTYKVENYVCSLTGGEEFEYDLMLEESAVETWASGFYFREEGNYRVKVYTRNDNSGKYVRFTTADGKSDGLEKTDATLGAGYFLLDTAGAYQDVARYDVSFVAVTGEETGCYMPNSPAAAGNDYYFVYKGNNKGTYKVSFLYAPSATSEVLYNAAIVEVSNNQGRYALATTSSSGNGMEPVYDKTENVPGAVYDYAEVITYIDAYAGIHSKLYDYYNYNGVTGVVNGSTWNATGGLVEYGGWVYVPLESAEEMEQTFLKDIRTNTEGVNSNTDAYFSVGTKIYVTGQKRPYRFYCQDGLQNNEWFKLLCYSNNPMDADGTTPYSLMIDGVGYDFEKTAEENLSNEVAKQLLDAFDKQFRIEIIQMQPQNLTVEDVESADLIYISNQEAINGLSHHWNNLSDAMSFESLPECDWDTYCPLTEEQDISTEVLMALYDECIYERNRALIVAHSVTKEDNTNEVSWPLERNLTKLYHMMNFFDEALNWAYFMPDMYPEVAIDEYSKIRTVGGEATVDTYKEDTTGMYNLIFPDLDSEEQTEEEVIDEANEHGEFHQDQVLWAKDYFLVYEPEDLGRNYPLYSYKDDIGANANFVREGETKLTVKYYIDPLFSNGGIMHRNIWQILRNRRLDTSVLVVEVTNAEKTAEAVPRNIIYADELDPESFDIDYKVMLLGTPKKPSSLTDITLTFEDGSSAGYGAILEYGVENTNNVRHGFTQDHTTNGLLNPSVTMRKVIITATDSNGKVGTAEVYVVVREAFMLN